MRVYRIAQSVVNGYDTYDSAVVIATSSFRARRIHPNGGGRPLNESRGDWAKTPDDVTAELIGDARANAVEGVVCASFNAG